MCFISTHFVVIDYLRCITDCCRCTKVIKNGYMCVNNNHILFQMIEYVTDLIEKQGMSETEVTISVSVLSVV